MAARVQVHIYAHACVQERVHTQVCTHTRARMHPHPQMRARAHTCLHTSECACMRIQTFFYACTHARTHARTHAHRSSGNRCERWRRQHGRHVSQRHGKHRPGARVSLHTATHMSVCTSSVPMPACVCTHVDTWRRVLAWNVSSDIHRKGLFVELSRSMPAAGYPTERKKRRRQRQDIHGQNVMAGNAQPIERSGPTGLHTPHGIDERLSSCEVLSGAALLQG